MEVDGHHIVAGVSSWGLGCGNQAGRQFAVYAEVAQVDLLTKSYISLIKHDYLRQFILRIHLEGVGHRISAPILHVS